MNKTFAIVKKELHSYFSSPIAYIILIATLSLFNAFFFLIIDQNHEASLRDMFILMEFMFVFLIPLLTMRMFSEEKANGTMEFLLTSPLSLSMIVLGKYLSMLIFYSLLIGMTLIYYFILEYFGNPDAASIFYGYVGIWLEGAFFIAVGLLVSSWTRNQIIAALVSYAVIFSLYFSTSFTKYFTGSTESFFIQLSTRTHLENFAVGIITPSNITYYLTGIILCLVLTRLSIDNRLWQ
ncbi:ABC transporter permease subunit [Brumicola nitratireducens]|uniref:ABC-2 type transporter n=1 Tax=Glaciecola nitratireducens (strain JCM 12485 / KCTC 12276 / FR1064) TaxID=1085623 RepID=G4QE85_GLANF|nr:ABC transporter permease subunit [Glaciecola nitratireducens]AEP31359.1 ABC-2 type transporter [Glaciecola nitratireducens FR1064]